MDAYYVALSPVFGLAVNVPVHVLWFRMFPGKGLLKSLGIGFAAGLLTVIASEAVLSDAPHGTADFIGIMAADVIAYMSLGYCYFNFVTLGETARRIRIVIEIYDSPEGLTMEEILERYNAKEILDRRFGRLLRSGQVLCRDNRYFVGKKTMVRLSWLITAMKLLVMGKRSEFE
jgi:hypothetical protein